MHSTTSLATAWRRVVTGLLAGALAASLAVLGPGQWTVASAAGVPTGLSPNGSSVSGIPTLSWTWVSDATSYDVEVHSDPEYKVRVWSASTPNRQIVPEVQLPVSALYWRVRARGSDIGEWSYASVTRSSVPGPAQERPADGATLAQPGDPVLLEWTPLPTSAAASYQVSISTDSDFTDPTRVTTYPTSTTSYVVPPQVASRYYWKVRGVLGTNIHTDWSATRSYEVTSLPPAVATMPSAPLNAQNQLIQDGDMYVDWAPVPGATTYDIQFDDDEDFSSLAHFENGIPSTRYSPPATLNHDQYYWRVRSRNSSGHVQEWPSSPTGEFERRWSDRIRLVHPVDRSAPAPGGVLFDTAVVISGSVHFEWEPVKLASRYELQMSTNKTFTPDNLVSKCPTVHTTFTPYFGGDGAGNRSCMPAAGGDYYWRVIGYDDVGNPAPSTDITADKIEVGRFQYRPERVALSSPAPNAEVKVPTLTWEALPGAAKYRVKIQGNGKTIEDVTAATSYTPRTLLTPGTYDWDVISVTEDGRDGTYLIGGGRPFQVVAQDEATADKITSVTPTSGDYGRFPTLTWTPVLGAKTYHVFMRKAGGVEWLSVDDTFVYPAGEDSGTGFLSPDTYEFWVQAKNDAGVVISNDSSVIGRFTIRGPGAVVDPRASLSGKGRDVGEVCRTDIAQGCQNLRQTPLLTWDRAAAPDQVQPGYWEVYLSRNADLTNLVGVGDGYPIEFPVRTTTNSWIPPHALPSGQSGVAYWWAVRPCSAAGVCGDSLPATRSFNIKALPVTLQGPGDPVGTSAASTVKVRDDITFTWQDYLATAKNTGATGPGVPGGYESVLATPATTEARQYQIQVAGNQSFTSDLWDNELVDQTSFTSIKNTYPEGINYWRVRAVDGSQNDLPWSQPKQFIKSSGSPTPTHPLPTPATDGLEPLRWQPMDYAATYNVEVFKAGDITASEGNLVVRATGVRQVAFSHNAPFPASSDPYVWRVQRVDAKGRKGAWSANAREASGWSSFTVTGASPTTGAPAAGATVAPLEVLFTWSAVPGASSYRFERRRPDSGVLVEPMVTRALAWTPRRVMDGGQWQWRVVSLDAAGKDMAASAWTAFTVTSGPSAVAPTRVDGAGAVGTMLTGTPPVWDLRGVQNSYQWFSGNRAIAGATGLSYTMTSADQGQTISLLTTGRLPGYASAESRSNAVAVSSGPAPNVTTPLSIAGSGRIGEVLSRTDVGWSVDGVTTAYQWLVDGRAVRGQDGPEFAVNATHLGKSISVTATGTKAGYATATVTSNAVVGAAGPAVTASAPPSISGDSKVGGKLSVSAGTWPEGSKVTYQWLRNGSAIAGATRNAYVVTPQDAALDLSVVVNASLAGFADGTATSAPVKVPKMVSATHAKLSAKQVTRKQRATISITVSVAGVKGPTGPVMVKVGRKKLAKVVLKASQSGAVTIKLPRLKKPKNKIKVFYVGTAQIAGSTSRAVKLVVKGR